MAVKADAAAQAQKLIFEATAFPQPAERLGGWSMLNCFVSLLMEELSEVDTRPVLRVEVRGTAGQVHVKVGAWVDLVMGNGLQFLCV